MKKHNKTTICHEVQVHYKRPLFDEPKKVTSSESVVALLWEYIDPERLDYKEFFWLLLLNNSNTVIGMSEIGVGNTTAVAVNYKEVLQLAILTNSVAIIVAHNHPSGALEPSKADRQLSEKLAEATKLLDISLLDHVIVTSEGYYSFMDNGLL
ncbi:JAB domain-containing protein [Candidatus Ulvibacter alkanivorans]|uniref:JAB domain-containing protein n=1 Tax=Candidatus Ulvibacter alkanivorans TaxID=2267620 RepID=UPI0014447CA9|nr:JAB domain-containing protein [Candidatus Ulvibacter alkanivorans]